MQRAHLGRGFYAPGDDPGAIYIEVVVKVEWQTVVAVAASLSAIFLGWINYNKSVKKDVAQDSGNNMSLKTDMEYIKRGVDDIRVDVRMQGQRVDGLAERVTRVEESAKQAHKRLDDLKN